MVLDLRANYESNAVSEGVREQDVDDNVRTQATGCNRLMKRSAQTVISCTTEYVPLGLL